MFDRTSHLAGFNDDYTTKGGVGSDVCANCSAISRETGVCDKMHTCQSYQEQEMRNQGATAKRKANELFEMRCTAI
jgi:hypothetical protein